MEFWFPVPIFRGKLVSLTILVPRQESRLEPRPTLGPRQQCFHFYYKYAPPSELLFTKVVL